MNAKVVFEADTRDLSKGAKEARKELQDFGKTSTDIADALGDAFGVDVQQLQKLSNSAQEFGRRLENSGKTGIASFGKLLQQIDLAKTALAGLGIGAAVSAFKLLTAEAENFKQTVAGARIEVETTAYLATYSQVMHDFNAETGKSVAEFEQKWKLAFGRFKTNLQQSLFRGLTGQASLGETLAGPVLSSLFGNKDQRQEAKAKSSESLTLSGEIYDLQRQIANKTVEWRDMEAQIAEYRRIAKDDTEGLATQTAAIAQAHALVEQRYGEEAALLQEIADKSATISGLAKDDIEAEDAMLAAQIKASDVIRNKETMLKSIERDQRTLTNAVSKEAAERMKSATALKQQADEIERVNAGLLERFKMLGQPGTANAPKGSGDLIGKATTNMQVMAPVVPVVDKEAAKTATLELASVMADGVTSMSESLGGLMADLITGESAWKNFGNSALSAFADMAISVGKMAIGTGIATSSIKTALKSLNGYAAIAAGAALVALGSAVKSGLSSVASGNYSAGASVASTSYGASSSGNGGYSTSSLNITVNGKLTASGSDLALVLNKENIRRGTVT